MRRAVLALLGLLIVAGIATGGYVYTTNRTPVARYRLAKVEQGPIAATVSATGNLAAVITVQVGSQVSGMIREILVDFNSPVRAGQLIARIDPEIFEAKVNQAQADLETAQATVLNQQANVERVRAEVENARAAIATAQAQVERVRAEVENARAAIATAQANVARETATVQNARRELERRVDLLRRELIAQSDKDAAQTAHDTATAQLEAARSQAEAARATLRSATAQLEAVRSQAKAAEAQLASSKAQLRVAEAQRAAAEAQVRQKRAALAQAKVDLDHTMIRAPVDGVIVSRNVDVGQTVAASLQAPVLFSIAQDLTRMQVETSVDEADIGRLREGMTVSFTVDAFPGQLFRGRIVQIRKAPQVIQNVVTYTVVVAVPNPDQTLMPGMTANVKILVERKENAVKIPLAALRFRPPGEAERNREPGGRPGVRGAPGEAARQIWVLGPDGQPKAVPVVLGLSDGSFAEVREGDLRPGQEVIVGSTEQPGRRGGSTQPGSRGLRF